MLRGLIIAAISTERECLQSPKGNRLLCRGELDPLKGETQAAFALLEK
jgi:hypothetical protein